MKKMISYMLVLACILGLLAGCVQEQPPDTVPATDPAPELTTDSSGAEEGIIYESDTLRVRLAQQDEPSAAVSYEWMAMTEERAFNNNTIILVGTV